MRNLSNRATTHFTQGLSSSSATSGAFIACNYNTVSQPGNYTLRLMMIEKDLDLFELEAIRNIFYIVFLPAFLLGLLPC